MKSSLPDREQCWVVATECTASRLRRASRSVGRVFDQVMAPSGLRGTQFNLLVALSLMGEAPVLRVADQLGIDRTTLTRNLQPLERDGLVASSPGADQRVRLLKLTEEGRRALVRAMPLWEKAQQGVVAGLGKGRWKELLQGLEGIERLGK